MRANASRSDHSDPAAEAVEVQPYVHPRSTFLQRLWRARLAYLFLLPSLLLTGWFSYVPAYTALTRAFTDWDGLNPPNFTGLENFRRAVTDPVMQEAGGLRRHTPVVRIFQGTPLIHLGSNRIDDG